MPRRTDPFQQLSTSIMANFYGTYFGVEESVLVKSDTTGAVRELDILIRHREDPKQSLLVECRDHKRKQDVQWIDQLDGKARSLGFTHVIAVSSSGFSKTAAAEAQERGITAIYLREAEQLDWKNWKFGIAEFTLNLDDRPLIKKKQSGGCEWGCRTSRLFIPRRDSGSSKSNTMGSVICLGGRISE